MPNLAQYQQGFGRRKPGPWARLDRRHSFCRGGVKGVWTFPATGGTAFDQSGVQANGSVLCGYGTNALGLGINPTGAQTTRATLKSTGPILGGLASWSVALCFSTTANNGRGRLYCERATTGNDILINGVDQNTVGKMAYFYRDDGATFFSGTGTITINDGLPHHSLFVRNGGTFTGYIDGAVDLAATSYAGTNTFTDAGLESWAAADKGDNTGVFTGIINYIYLFPFALTQADAQLLRAQPYAPFLQPAPSRAFFGPAAAGFPVRSYVTAQYEEVGLWDEN